MGWSFQGPAHIGLLMLLVILAADARECKIGCHGSSGNILKFEPGKIYSYKLEGNSVTKLAGATEDQNKIGITADVQVSLLSSCEHVLKVTNVHISGPNAKKYKLDKLSQQPIKFGLQNGRLESELCVNPAEDTAGLNIKRAVLSLIQSGILKDSGYATQQETDIFGTCPTGFEFSKSGNTITVKKNRDLMKCAHREDITKPYLATPYYIKSDIQSSPLLISSLVGEQKIEGGVLKLASREEQYDYRPGATPEATAHVSVKTTLTFVSAAAGALPAVCTEPKSIIYEPEHAPEAVNTAGRIVEILRQTCDSPIIGQDTAQRFSKLVQTVASSSKQDINAALQQVKSGAGFKDKDVALSTLKDAIVMARTASSVEIMAEFIKKQEVKGNAARLWLLGLGAVKHASRASLLAVLPLLDGEPDVNAYLGIGSLAGKYCSEHHCEGVNEVNQLQIKLGAPLLKGCRASTKKDENQLIASLKGLGNIKYLGPKIAAKIIECAEDKNVRPRIRAAALETIRTDPNKEQFKNLALNILKNVEEDSELRIKAYLVLAQCPCGKVAAAIKDLLSKEESYQVGGFIVSHLRNLQATTNPDRQAARHHLAGIIPPRRFVIDPRRYSLNQELSYSADIINTGAAGEANIIYSQNSYIPRTLSLNLTVQLFGTAYNLFELDTRAENLEYVAEKIFGPKGYLKTNDVDDFYHDGKDAVSTLFEKISSRYDEVLRPKRSISRDTLNAMASKVHIPKASDDIDLDLSLKVLGSEVLWQHVHGSEVKKINAQNIVDDYFGTVDDLIGKLKNTDIDYRRQLSLLDEEVTYPTGMGLALKLKTQVSGALRVKLNGKLDIPAIIRDPKNTNVRLQFIPSAAINVAGELLIDAIAIEAGTRVDLNLHTSTGSDVTLRVLSGQGVDIKLGLPISKQEVVSLKFDVTSVVRDDAQVVTSSPIAFDTKRETYSGCFDQLNQVIGLTFCGEVSVPYETGRPIFPIYGPVNLAIRIEKEDESLSAYHIKALHEYKEEDNAHKLELLLDTPNSKNDRKLSLTVEGSVKSQKKYLAVNVESPWTKANLNAHLVNTDTEKSINAKLTHDGAQYEARAGVGVTKSGNKVRYEPIFEYKAPEGTKSALIGKKGGQKQKQQSVSCGGYITEEINGNRHSYKIEDLSITTPRTSFIIDGTLLVEPQLGSTDLKIKYDKEQVTIRGKLKTDSKHELHTELVIGSTQYPDLGISLNYDLLVDNPNPGQYDSKLVLVHGPDPGSQVSRLYVHNSYERILKDGKIALLATQHELTYPVLKLEVLGKGKITPKSLSGTAKGKLDKYSALLDGSAEFNLEGDYQISVNGELMGNELKLQTSRTLEGPDKSKFKNILILKPGGTYQLNADVVHKVKDGKYDFQIDAEASVPSQSSIKLVAGIQNGGNFCGGNVKFNVGDKCLIEAQSVYKSDPTPSGNYKLVLTGYLESEGKLTSDNTKLNGISTLYFPKADRKIEATADLVKNSPNYSGTISICYDTKDRSKTIKIQTQNTINNNNNDYSFDSRNVISHDKSELKINTKGKLTGSSAKHYLDTEVEVIFPNKYEIGGKYSYSINLEGENREGKTTFELYDKGEGLAPQKLKLSAIGKHISITEATIDGQALLAYTSRDGKALNIHTNLKKQPNSNGKTSSVSGEVGASGDLVEKPISFKLESEISNEYFDIDDSLSLETDLPLLSYKFAGSVGSDVNVEVVGKLNGATISNHLSAKLPESSPVKSLKIVSNNLIDISDESIEKSKIKLNNAVYWNDKHVSVNVEGNLENNGLQYVVEYETESISKRRAAGSVHFSGEESKADASLNLSYDGKSADLHGKVEVNKEKTAANVHVLWNSPEQGKVEATYRQKLVKDGRGFHADITISTKDKQLSGNAKVELEPEHPIIQLNLDHPEGKSEFLFKSDKKGENHYASEVKAKWTVNGGGSFEIDSESNLASPDNFFIKANANSPQLNWNKVHVDISNKPAKGEAKKITFTIKSDDKIIASGTSNYNYKDEGGNAVLDGSGNLKIGEENYPLTFHAGKQIKDNLQVGKLNIKAGKRSLVLETKLTPEEFLFERTYCKDTKQCSKALITSKAVQNGLEGEEQTVKVLLDLSLYNPNLHDISYSSSYKRQKVVIDHNIEFQWAADAKLKYNGFLHEKSAGAYFTFPKRTIGGEVKYDISRKKDNIGSMKVEFEAHLNKGKDPKLYFVAATTVQYNKGVAIAAGETKLAHPSLAKDLIIRGQLQLSDNPSQLVDGLVEVDFFKDPKKKVVSTITLSGSKEHFDYKITLKSEGCNIDIVHDSNYKYIVKGKDSHFLASESIIYKDSKNNKHQVLLKAEVKSDKLETVVKFPEFVVLDANYILNKGYTGSLNIFGRKYQDSLTINKDANLLKYQLSGLEGGKSFNVEAGFKIGSNGILKASLGDKKAFSLDVALDEANFLKSKYSYDTEVAKSIYTIASTEINILANEAAKVSNVVGKRLSEDFNQVSECLIKGLPDFKALGENVQTQLAAIKEEIESDKTLQETAKLVKHITGAVGEQVIAVAKEINHFLITIADLLKQSTEQLVAAIKEIVPKVQQSIQRIAKVLNKVLEQYLKLSVEIFNVVLDKIKEHEADLKKFADATVEYVQEIGKIIGKIIITLNQELEKFIKQNIDHLNELPIVTELQERLKEFKDLQIPEEVYNVYREVIEGLKQILPTPEANNFLDTLSSVIEKLVKREKISDDLIKELYNELVQAVKSIIALIAQNAPSTSLLKPAKLQSSIPLHLLRIPTGGIRFSLVNLLSNKQFLPGLNEILGGIKLSLNPLSYIPPYTGYGYVIGGTEVITFDGLHLNIQGKCSYILAEDYKDRNFSVVGQMQNGALQSITLSSKEDSIEIKPTGNAVVNGQPSTYPANAGEVAAWKRPHSIGVATKAGAVVICSPNFDNCVIEVSGFYYGKLRGLLGNLNGETYDERTTPEGKIVQNSGDLANSWKLHSSCEQCPTAAHKHNRVPLCTEIFTEDPSVLLCRPFVNPAPYRDACDDLTSRSSKKEEAACAVNRAYTFACRKQGLFVAKIADKCSICDIDGKKVGFDDDSIKVEPGNAADIVLVTELTKQTEPYFKEVAIPLILALKNQLASKGISDVNVKLIGGNSPKSYYHNYYTNHQGQLVFDPSSNNLKFEEKVPENNETVGGRIKILTNHLLRETGLSKRARMYQDILEEDLFRPNALKSIIAVHGESCGGPTPGTLAYGLIKAVQLELDGISFDIIAPLKNFKVENSEVAVLNEVESVLIGGEKVPNVQYSYSDICVSLAYENEGNALNGEGIRSSPKKAQLIQIAAEKITSSIFKRKKTLDCSCSLRVGLVPQPQCITLD